ncbi:hypothetical protein [Accumulibacter sp.]|jgi:hypothetical protein|uniref:Uncharacterized protein n=1 Tax=Accumulibacter regalis TaxID=522306 RepID=C7RT68_ACCRE|nr:hypothetical protein [Accumulibacter sp.]MBN8499218.1 hypothetical protein [Accumulibacter sp.]MBO3707903.1 hypothetical protein [Candidatus Accumulibacter conexus]MBO3714757.1 hypothetical protein [Accumulibacter sp.]
MTGTRRSLLYGVLLLLMLWAAFPGRWAWNEHLLAKAEEEKKAALARKARALYEEKCRTVAGEKIYRTVLDVEGIVLLKVRPQAGGREWADLMWPGAAFALESRADEYITTFLGYEQSSREGVPVTPDRRGYINTNYVPENASNLPGYRYVDVIDEKDGQRYRYTGSNKVVGKKDITAPNVQLGIKNDPTYDLNVYQWTLVKSLAPDPSPRYGVTFEDHVIPDERALGVASSTVRVLDIKTGEVLGEMTRFAWGSTKPSGFNPTPWLTAWKCPAHGVGANAATRKFVDQVLVPRSNH